MIDMHKAARIAALAWTLNYQPSRNQLMATLSALQTVAESRNINVPVAEVLAYIEAADETEYVDFLSSISALLTSWLGSEEELGDC